jgi:KaiC/GvpD/RAD55 family RecA-like ATPase
MLSLFNKYYQRSRRSSEDQYISYRRPSHEERQNNIKDTQELLNRFYDSLQKKIEEIKKEEKDYITNLSSLDEEITTNNKSNMAYKEDNNNKGIINNNYQIKLLNDKKVKLEKDTQSKLQELNRQKKSIEDNIKTTEIQLKNL